MPINTGTWKIVLSNEVNIFLKRLPALVVRDRC